MRYRKKPVIIEAITFEEFIEVSIKCPHMVTKGGAIR